MINKFKINKSNIKKGGAQAAYNTSSPVDADLSTGSLEHPLKTEFKNTHGCPLVVVNSHKRNGGVNDMKTMVGANKDLISPNEETQIQDLINNCHIRFLGKQALL